MLSIPTSARNSANSGWSLGAWPQRPDLAARARGPRVVTIAISFFTPGSRSSNRCARSSESRSTPSVSCVRSFEPIEKPSKSSRELVGEDHVVRDLAHHVDLEPVLARGAGRCCAISASTRRPSLERAAERDHHLDVGEPHVVAHAPDAPRTRARSPRGSGRRSSATRRGSRSSGSPRSARTAAPPSRPGVLVGLEVGEAHDDRPRVEGGGDLRDAAGQPVDEELRRRRRSRGARADLGATAGSVDALGVEQRHRMDADPARDDELDAREPDAGARQLAEAERVLAGCRRSA